MQTTDDGLWPIEECDVEDKERLKLFREKRSKWISWLSGDDEHSICHQLWLMNWSYLAYRLINESRRIAVSNGRSSAALNGIIGEFCHEGFVANQILAINCLLDRSRDVISLIRLQNEVVTNQHLFTREIFVGFKGAPFDPSGAIAERDKEICENMTPRGYITMPVLSGPKAGEHAERLHKIFDRLSNTPEPILRRRQDLISISIFDKLTKMMNDPSIQKVRLLRNKRLAHRACPQSRNGASQGISFNEIDAAHRVINVAVQFLSHYVFNDEDVVAVPVQQFDLFEHLDVGWTDTAGIAELSRLWDRLVGERKSWMIDAADTVISDKDARHTLNP